MPLPAPDRGNRPIPPANRIGVGNGNRRDSAPDRLPVLGALPHQVGPLAARVGANDQQVGRRGQTLVADTGGDQYRVSGLDMQASRPRQTEFARGNLDYTVMSKRKLISLVQEGMVDGWDDPRMPTLIGARRRGFPAAAIRTFWERMGYSKQVATIEFSVLEGVVREELDVSAARRMAVLDPIKLVLSNLPEAHEEQLKFSNHPKNEDFGTRQVPFSRELWIEREDFMEVPAKGFHRLVPGGEVRLRGAGIARCEAVIKDADGRIVELRGSLDLDSRPGMPGADRKIKGTIHWVSARHALAAEVRLYDRLFDVPDPDDDTDGKTYRDHLNPNSKRVVQAWLEPSLAGTEPEQRFQFERLGFFVADRRDHSTEHPVFNRIVTLRDSYAKPR